MAMYKYSGRLTLRRARNRGCHAANGTGPYVDNRAPSRRSVLKQSLRSGGSGARRTAFSVALAIFWRMLGEVQRAGTIAPGHEGMAAVCGTAPPAWSGWPAVMTIRSRIGGHGAALCRARR